MNAHQIAAEAAEQICKLGDVSVAVLEGMESIIEAAIKKAREQDDHEFIQCPSCGWHPVRKE